MPTSSVSFFLNRFGADRVRRDMALRESFQTQNPLRQAVDPPAFVLVPANVRELQEMVKTANDSAFPLVPVSSGPPHKNGGIACPVPHAVVDLRSWKYIGDIDRRNRVCRVGPGTNYEELLAALAPHGLTLPTPLAPRKNKSVLAAVMDREPTIWPNKQWDLSDPVGSTEFIFGNGERFRTGAAGAPGSLETQRQAGGARKCPLGPSQTDFHRVVQGAQGTMGIVTWITLRCEVLPRQESPYLIGSDRLQPLLEFVYAVQRPWLGEHMFVLNRRAAEMLLPAGKDEPLWRRLPESLPRYICLQNIAGFDVLPRQRIDYQTRDITEIAERQGLTLHRRLGELDARRFLDASRTPGPENGQQQNLRGAALSVAFQSTLNRAPEMIQLARQAGGQITPGGFGETNGTEPETGPAVYLQPQVQNHMCHLEFVFAFPLQDPEAETAARRLEADLVPRLMDAGAFFSRPYGRHQAAVFRRDPANLALLKQIKAIFDPNGILNPGRWGIDDNPLGACHAEA